MPGAVERAVKRVPGIETADVELVWDPPWTQDRMSDEARLELGLM
jgi:metal-sulfur cluster biosynthetic enzyme